MLQRDQKGMKQIIKISKTNIKMQNKPCDWICVNCKNLNYSFRKICNRCQQCTRDAPGTRFIPNKVDQGQQLLETIKLQDLSGSGHSQSTVDSNDEDEVVFSQALFLQDLSKKTENYNKSFSFMKQCSICSNQNYFYQQKCCHCGFSAFI